MKQPVKYVILAVLVAASIAIPVTLSSFLSPLISVNEQYARVVGVLSAFHLPVAKSRADVFAAYKASVADARVGELRYSTVSNGTTGGYAFDIVAPGNNGPIRGILALASDRRTVLGLSVYEHNEGPGSGDEISSAAWRNQFANLPLFDNAVFRGIAVISGKKKEPVAGAIHGDTPAAAAVVRALNRMVAQFYAGGRPVEELDLGTTVDAVTRATPGYPKHVVKPPNLREEVKRPPFMVPPGLTNLALGRPVTVSMPPIIGDPAQIVDNVKKSGDFDFVELGKGVQWAQIDLGDVRTIFTVCIWHFYKNSIIYKSVIVRISDDPAFIKDVKTIYNNDYENIAGFGEGKNTTYYARWWGELADARGDDYNGVRGRYVRIYTAGGAGGEDTRFVEIAVYGK
ncbi:MAG: FMN-binding protein [Spirochaetes bacterium]|nr:FMN-binding protein [Spirochaetota bacterium]